MKSFFHYKIGLLVLIASITLSFSSCVTVYFTSNYAEMATKYLHGGPGEWETVFWDYYAYENVTVNTTLFIADTIMHPKYTWVFTNEDGTDVHGINRLGYIELEDGSKQEFEWDIYGETQYDETPTLYFFFPDSNNIFNLMEQTTICEKYSDNIFRFSFYQGAAGYLGFHSETVIELEKK